MINGPQSLVAAAEICGRSEYSEHLAMTSGEMIGSWRRASPLGVGGDDVGGMDRILK